MNLVHKIITAIDSNRQVFKNMTWLSVLQFANYLIPLLIIPYIVRILGVELFGKVSYAQNIITYFTLIVNFGFEYSATRKIAIHKNDTEKVRVVFWTVIIQKAMLLVVSFLGLIALYFTFPKVNQNFTLYLFVFLINVGFVFFPTWLFQGFEKMGKMAVFTVLARGLGLVFTLLLVKSASDYLLYPALMSFSYILFGLIAFVYAVKHFNLASFKTNKTIGKEIFKEGFPVFLNSFFTSAYTIANMTILGFFVTNTVLGYYSGAYKIIMAICLITTTPIGMAIYPKISRKFTESKTAGALYLKKVGKFIVLYGLLISLLTFVATPFLVNLILGESFEPSINLLRLFSVLPFLIITASLFTIQGIYGAGLQKYAPWIGFTIGVFCISLNLILIPKFGMYGAALSWIASQMLEIIISGAVFYKKINK